MFQGPSEAPQSELEVKGTLTEFDLRSFVQKNQSKGFRTSGQIQSMLMGVHVACCCVTVGVYTKAQGLVKVDSVTLDLVGSDQFSCGCVIPNKIHLSN